jgi:hypothetical protein
MMIDEKQDTTKKEPSKESNEVDEKPGASTWSEIVKRHEEGTHVPFESTFTIESAMQYMMDNESVEARLVEDVIQSRGEGPNTN